MDQQKTVAVGEILFDVYPNYKKLGGAPFNFLYHMYKITENAAFVSRVGEDAEGAEIREFVNRVGVGGEFIQRDPDRPTGEVRVTLDESKTPTFDILEDRAYDRIEETDAAARATDGAVLYYGTLAQRSERSRKTIRALWERGEKFFYDVNLRQDYYDEETLRASLERADVAKLNAEELEIVWETFFDGEFQRDRAIDETLRRFDLEILCVTLGGDGATLARGEERSRYHAEVEVVKDTVGAGDAYAAALCLGWLRGDPLDEINRRASEFAAAIVGVEGALPVSDEPYEILKA
jgi:fructokinase